MKFEDVLVIKNGRNQRAVENPQGRYPIYGSGGIMGYADDYICKADTVVIGRKGSINNPLFVKEPFWNVDTAFGLEADRSVLLPMYLFYFCRHFDFERLNKAVTIPSLTKSDLLKIEIDVPDLRIQQSLVERLSSIEGIIQLRKQQLVELDNLVKARFVEMFGEPTTNSKNWKRVRFDSLCENLDGKRRPITSTDREAGPYPYYGASGIVDHVAGFIFDEDILLVSEDGANLLARSTPIAFSISGKVWVNNHAHVLRFNNFALQKYVEYYFSMISIEDYITGSTQPKLNQAKLNSMMIPLPSDSLQEIFMRFIAEVDKSKAVVQKALDEAQTLFDSLMQQYFG